MRQRLPGIVADGQGRLDVLFHDEKGDPFFPQAAEALKKVQHQDEGPP